jgi:signal peptidase II
MNSTSNRRIALIALAVLALDQFTKYLVKRYMYLEEERVIINGFFKLVHWGNTGAAWSLMMGKNGLLAGVAIVAIIVLYRSRHHFEAHTVWGQMALGLIFGGILGNLSDRLLLGSVTDFIRFYLQQRGGREIGFPAFNVADSAICVGVGLIFIATLRNSEKAPATPAQTKA